MGKSRSWGRWCLYPWGNEWDPTRCQHNQTGTASVTAHTAGASPYGCEDMLGNASEWTRTLWGPDPIQSAHPYPYKHDQREDITAPGHRLYRGGSFRDTPDRLRCSARNTLVRARPSGQKAWFPGGVRRS